MAGDLAVCGPNLGKVGRPWVNDREAQRCRVSEIERGERLRQRDNDRDAEIERDSRKSQKGKKGPQKNRHGEGDPCDSRENNRWGND